MNLKKKIVCHWKNLQKFNDLQYNYKGFQISEIRNPVYKITFYGINNKPVCTCDIFILSYYTSWASNSDIFILSRYVYWACNSILYILYIDRPFVHLKSVINLFLVVIVPRLLIKAKVAAHCRCFCMYYKLYI